MDKATFIAELERNFAACDWEPLDGFSVFFQFDASYYLSAKDAFTRKYKLMWAIARTIMPKKMIELGTHAGSSMDAYVSGAGCEYVGIDIFTPEKHENAPEDWQPMEIAAKLIAKRGFSNITLIKKDLRTMERLNHADFVVVDAAHDFENALADIKLALTAYPEWIYIDDLHGDGVAKAWDIFVWAFSQRIAWSHEIEHHDGSVIVKLRQ